MTGAGDGGVIERWRAAGLNDVDARRIASFGDRESDGSGTFSVRRNGLWGIIQTDMWRADGGGD